MADRQRAEELIKAWVKLSGILKNSRITRELAYNEAIIMMLIYERYRNDGKGIISIKEITAETNMLKSLVNRTVNSLSKMGLLERCDAAGDKRMVFVRCVKNKLDTFLKVHRNSLEIADGIIDIIGEDDAAAFLRIVKKLSDAQCNPTVAAKSENPNKKGK